jgi:non-ribosomal peptide synthetase component E (peptide arylation enzyme)
MEFLNRKAKDRYVIPDKLILPKECPPTAIEDVHKDILIRKYNLETLATLFKELD